MTNKIRRTEIRIETHEVTIIRGLSAKNSKYCERCRKMVTGFTPEQVSAFQLLIETNEIHFVETRNNSAQIVCGHSLGRNKNKDI